MPKMNLIALSERCAATVLTVLIAVSGCSAAPVKVAPACERITLGESAGVNFVAGLPYYVYPRSVDKLNGCQTMWDSKGRMTMQIVFREGNAVEYLEYADSGAVRLSCSYAGDVARPQTCPKKQDISAGFGVLSVEVEKSLPNFDDLRRQRK
jgi:hypothetical protein